MKLSRIDNAISTCEQHLKQTNSYQTEIESFLTRYLLVLICATFEEEIKNILFRRLDRINDNHISSYIKYNIDKNFRSIKSSEIAGKLKQFGDDYKEAFQNRANGTIEETYYNNIINNRHLVAHSSGTPLTFNDLITFYEKGHLILDYLNEALEN